MKYRQLPNTIQEICAALAEGGREGLARRIAYFASDEDLEEGDVPVTLESAVGFWEFFKVVESEGKIRTGCSQEGWICSEWEFEDRRGVSLWFKDFQQVMFAATDANGKWVRIASGTDTGSRDEVAKKLVEAGLFTWLLESPADNNSPPQTMLPGTAGAATQERTGGQPPMRFYSENKRFTYLPIGWSIFTG